MSYSIKLSTNGYQASRNILFKPHQTTATLQTGLTLQEAKDKLELIVYECINGARKYTTEDEYILDIMYCDIEDHLDQIEGCIPIEDNIFKYYKENKKRVKLLFDQKGVEGYEGEGIYDTEQNHGLVYDYGLSFHNDGYYYGIIKNNE